MSFHDVAFLPSRGSFSSTTFLTICGIGEGLGATTCLDTLVGVMQGHAPSKILLLDVASFCVNFNGDHKTAYKDEVQSGHPQFWGYYQI